MSQYDSLSTERMWQEKWKEWEIYRFDKESERPIYSIDNPPRYTSGSLHLGHATGYSLIDFAARYRRMKGYNVFYPLCFDVNGTPTEVKVEKKYGITKLDLPRTEYRKLCSEYANGFIDEMTHHFEILGQSMDPSIYYQTDAPYYRRITQISFLRLLKMGLAYKGDYPVNWCPRCMTALADAEVEYRDNVTDLNYIRFPLADGEGDVIIATTRPELICTCQTVAVHPEDKDKKGFVGKELITPLYGKKVKIIADPKVDPDYGTGVVMICTIGDKVDLEWVMKYNLPLEKGIDECGHMTPIAGPYEGMKVKEAREAIIRDLKEKGYLIKQEKQKQNVSVCWRCHENIEFLQVPQWFLKTLDFKERVLKRADEVNWFPEFMKIRLRDWVESLEWDWVLSRQRIFATPIPIWECENCGEVVPAEEEQCYVDPTEDDPPVDSCPRCGGNLKGCEDVFDTWMDSSASSLYNCFWERDEVMFKKMFPMSLRPQSHDIIRTWAFYTLLRSEQLTGSIPWRDIMVHGFIMAPDGTPMHSSLGNVIDPLPIIEEYGADALRYYACTCSLGVDHAFREKDVIRGRRFSNKIFNMGNFVGSKVNRKPQRPNNLSAADKWILSRYSEVVKHVD
ncbi:MAG TPA: valine--tRNA ligase, partial [Candidatus Methanomethylophilaceae archaeon]|nr:valine--tRNA ligase [Candidatus Methanomethylophilaceae archaeon]